MAHACTAPPLEKGNPISLLNVLMIASTPRQRFAKRHSQVGVVRVPVVSYCRHLLPLSQGSGKEETVRRRLVRAGRDYEARSKYAR
ncbi:hypothetical protein CBOM_07893 [Ceraceosorus bombacis]|uniref:Uncharacterized protein n=1 Tax=Ceraceosorus bombacis TaxID=401625 RepID=A0A0P1BJS4_9BASI|nr:hypothetical protein CBOM_07893 [Ceraceosorus bombacis]